MCGLVCNAVIRCARHSRKIAVTPSSYLNDGIPILASIVAENKATKPFADKALFWCLKLDTGGMSHSKSLLMNLNQATIVDTILAI